MATYLITGGCGFIGSNLADALVGRGDRVRILDDLSTGRRENAPAAADLVVGDVADPATVAAAMADVDGCFHLAAVASVQRCQEDPVGTHAVNSGGTVNVLAAARRRRTPVVYASSAAVYGLGADAPVAEGAVARPISNYGVDKLASEMHARVAGLTDGVPTVGLRFFNVFGRRQDPHSPYSGVISIFRARLASGLPITIHGDGQQIRDFIHVDDVVRHLVAAMNRPSPEPLVVNVCTGRGTSIRRLADIMADLLGVEAVLEHQGARPGDIRVSIGDPAAATRYFGIGVDTPLKAALALTLEETQAAEA